MERRPVRGLSRMLSVAAVVIAVCLLAVLIEHLFLSPRPPVPPVPPIPDSVVLGDPYRGRVINPIGWELSEPREYFVPGDRPVNGTIEACLNDDDVYVLSVGELDGVQLGDRFEVRRGDAPRGSVVVNFVAPHKAGAAAEAGGAKLELSIGDVAIRRMETRARIGFTSGSIRSPWVGGCTMPYRTADLSTLTEVTDPKMLEAIEKEFEKQREEALHYDVEQRQWIDSRHPPEPDDPEDAEPETR